MDALDNFLTSHCNFDTPSVSAERATIERALKAVIRGLVATGTSSPVLNYYVMDFDLLPWAKAREAATREGAALCDSFEEAHR